MNRNIVYLIIHMVKINLITIHSQSPRITINDKTIFGHQRQVINAQYLQFHGMYCNTHKC